MRDEGRSRLYGRERILRFVADALKRGAVPERPLPIVLLAGPRGSGATVVLDELWELHHEETLCVSLDLASAQDVGDVVLATMQGIQRRVIGIRPVRFGRLLLALKALSFVDDGGGRRSFDAYMRTAPSAAAVQSLTNWAQRASQLLSPEQRLVAGLLAELVRLALSRIDHARDSALLAWFATNKIYPGQGHGYDPLWDLYRWRHEGTDEAALKVNRTLCAALLEDLRTDYHATGLLRGRRPRNCLLLADDAGGKVGSAFLDLIEESRRATYASAGAAADPLLMVAAWRGLPPQNAGTPIDATDEALDFAAMLADRAVRWWYPIRLTELTLDDVVDMTLSTTTRYVLGNARHDADFVYELSAGHPAATRQLIDLLARAGTRSDIGDLLGTVADDQ